MAVGWASLLPFGHGRPIAKIEGYLPRSQAQKPFLRSGVRPETGGGDEDFR